MSTIRSGNTETTGLAYQSDTTGNLVFETMGVTAVTITNSQNVDLAGNLSVAGNITGNLSVTGNIAGSYILGNGSQLTGLPEGYADADVAAYLPTFAGNIGANHIAITNSFTGATVSVTGNITSSYFLGNGSQLTGIDATSIQNGNSNVQVLANSDVVVGVAGTANVAVLAASGLTVSSNISGGNLITTGTITATGNISTSANINVTNDIVAGGDVVTASDLRLKSNIQPISHALEMVCELSGKTYTKNGKHHQYGLIAQDVEKILPTLVHTADDALGTKSVNYQNMVAILIEAVKELQLEVQQLKGNSNGV